MGFCIFMLFVDLLIPVTMIVLGWIFKHKSPREINGTYGYRTSMSTKNSDTWQFAHNYSGALWFKFGIITLVPSVILMLFAIGSDINTIAAAGLGVCIIQGFFLIGTTLFTEKALKRTFDIHGNRIE